METDAVERPSKLQIRQKIHAHASLDFRIHEDRSQQLAKRQLQLLGWAYTLPQMIRYTRHVSLGLLSCRSRQPWVTVGDIQTFRYFIDAASGKVLFWKYCFCAFCSCSLTFCESCSSQRNVYPITTGGAKQLGTAKHGSLVFLDHKLVISYVCRRWCTGKVFSQTLQENVLNFDTGIIINPHQFIVDECGNFTDRMYRQFSLRNNVP